MITLTDLNLRVLRKNELQANFNAIEDALPVSDEAITEIDFRNLKNNKIALQAEFGYPDEVSYTLDSTGTYKIINESVIEHVCSDASVSNKGIEGGNVIHVTGYLYAIYDKPSTTGTLEVYVAAYDGTQRDIVATTKRFVGYGTGSVKKPYTNNTETSDYMDNVTDWSRPNMPFDYPVGLVAAFGGDVKSAGSNGKTKFAIAVDAVLVTGPTAVGLVSGNINLNARVGN